MPIYRHVLSQVTQCLTDCDSANLMKFAWNLKLVNTITFFVTQWPKSSYSLFPSSMLIHYCDLLWKLLDNKRANHLYSLLMKKANYFMLLRLFFFPLLFSPAKLGLDLHRLSNIIHKSCWLKLNINAFFTHWIGFNKMKDQQIWIVGPFFDISTIMSSFFVKMAITF